LTDAGEKFDSSSRRLLLLKQVNGESETAVPVMSEGVANDAFEKLCKVTGLTNLTLLCFRSVKTDDMNADGLYVFKRASDKYQYFCMIRTSQINDF